MICEAASMELELIREMMKDKARLCVDYGLTLREFHEVKYSS